MLSFRAVILIYEDDQWRKLLPLVHLRPVFDLRCGRRTLFEKFQVLYPREKLALLVRADLSPLARELHPELPVDSFGTSGPRPLTPLLFLSGRVILDRPLPVRGREEVFTNGTEIVGFRVKPARVKSLPIRAAEVRRWRLPERRVLATIVRYPWNLVEFNGPELNRELRVSAVRTPRSALAGVLLVGNPRNLQIARSATVEPGTLFDLRLGRILVDEHAQIRARSVVAGPCYVGPGTIIDAALVRPGCSFGPECRIGGEVEASIFLGRANKHHEGFIGHAVVGEWVNLGALTTNSDLRNDYGEVGVVIDGKSCSTMLRKFGCVIADHAKTAIGTLFNTGTIVGIFANWFEPGLSPRVIPDFARGSRARGKIDELIITARTAMSRRGVRLSRDYEQLVRRIYAQR